MSVRNTDTDAVKEDNPVGGGTVAQEIEAVRAILLFTPGIVAEIVVLHRMCLSSVWCSRRQKHLSTELLALLLARMISNCHSTERNINGNIKWNQRHFDRGGIFFPTLLDF